MAGMKLVRDRISPSTNRIVAKIQLLPKEAYDYWKGITPIKTGNARRKTRLQGSKIKANYNYAVPLDEGHSKQAPKGMVKPTEAYLKRLLRKKIRK
jgi:hypothetical protein